MDVGPGVSASPRAGRGFARGRGPESGVTVEEGRLVRHFAGRSQAERARRPVFRGQAASPRPPSRGHPGPLTGISSLRWARSWAGIPIARALWGRTAPFRPPLFP